MLVSQLHQLLPKAWHQLCTYFERQFLVTFGPAAQHQPIQLSDLVRSHTVFTPWVCSSFSKKDESPTAATALPDYYRSLLSCALSNDTGSKPGASSSLLTVGSIFFFDRDWPIDFFIYQISCRKRLSIL